MLIAGPRHFTDYPTLRAALDALLAKRLHDVVLLTSGGRGVTILAASYVGERGLVVTARVADFVRFPVGDAERRYSLRNVTRVAPVPRVSKERGRNRPALKQTTRLSPSNR